MSKLEMHCRYNINNELFIFLLSINYDKTEQNVFANNERQNGYLWQSFPISIFPTAKLPLQSLLRTMFPHSQYFCTAKLLTAKFQYAEKYQR